MYTIIYLSLGDANNTTGDSATGISSGFAQFDAAASQIVRVSMNHKRSANNGVCSIKTDQSVLNVDIGGATCVGHHISQIANMPFFIRRASMGLSEWVEVSTGGGAAVGVVSKLVHVKSMLASRQTLKSTGDSHCIRATLFKKDGSSNVGVALEDGNGFNGGHFARSECEGTISRKVQILLVCCLYSTGESGRRWLQGCQYDDYCQYWVAVGTI